MGKLLADMTPLRESPAFRRLWLGSAVSAVGSQLTLVAVSLEVYRLTGDSFYVGLLGVFALVPLVFGGLLGGSIADSHDRRTVALLATAVLWLTTGMIALQSWLQLGNVWVLYLLVALQSAAQAINQPARSAIIPVLIRKELLPAANALSMVSFGLALTAGPLQPIRTRFCRTTSRWRPREDRWPRPRRRRGAPTGHRPSRIPAWRWPRRSGRS